MLASANALSSAIATLGKDPLYASALGTLAGVTDIPAQVYAYQTALAAGKIDDQTAALSSIAVDSAGIANTAATTIAGWATAIGNSGLADLMGEIGENANDFALAVGAVGTAVDVGNWFNSTFLPGFNKWIGNTPPQLDEDMLLNLNDPSGDSEIIMPGASGDTLAEKPLSGGAFQYTENNAQGTQTSSVQLAYNGSVDELMVTGAGVVADVSAFQINVSTGATDTISGNNDTINAGASSTTALYGTGGIVNFIPNSGAIFRLYNADSSATVNGTGNTVGIWATGDSVTASGEHGHAGAQRPFARPESARRTATHREARAHAVNGRYVPVSGRHPLNATPAFSFLSRKTPCARAMRVSPHGVASRFI